MFQILAGVVIILLGIFTLVVPAIPLIWIGAFLWGGRLIYDGLTRWGTDKKSSDHPVISVEPPKDDPSNIVFNCGQCGRKAVVPKNQGTIKVKCLGCSRESRIST